MAIVTFKYEGIYLCAMPDSYSIGECVVDSEAFRVAWYFLGGMKLKGVKVKEYHVWNEINRVESVGVFNKYDYQGEGLCRLIERYGLTK